MRRSGTRLLWLRWSLRDLRHNWVSVITIALVIAIGTGVFAGLGSTGPWRRETNDASFAALRLHDLRIELSPGTFTEEGSLLDVAGSIASADALTAVSERLVVDSQLSTSTDEGDILVRARVVGTDVAADAPVDAVWVRDGMRPGPSGSDAILEAKFADFHDLGPGGSVLVAGGSEVPYVGLGVAPEQFYVSGPNGEVFAESDLAHVYLPLAAAQNLVGRAGEVNDAVLTVADPAQVDEVAAELHAALDALGVSGTVTGRDAVDSFRVLYEDIDSDQQVWNALSALVLFAAALAAFNLVSRVVESQRREIGIGMALGATRARLAVRPMLVGVQVAVLGVVAGVVSGVLIGAAMADLLESFLPMPEYRSPFQYGVFARAALLGFCVPLVASAIPTWRAVRVEPIEAIRTGYLAARTGRIGGWIGHVRLPGSSVSQLPLRNILRTPRRTVLTALGVAAAITALIAVMGMLDSFEYTIDRGEAEVTRAAPDRVLIQLDTFYPEESDVVSAIAAADSVASTDNGLRLPVQLADGDGGEGIDLLLELVDFDSAAWTPTVTSGGPPGDGIVLAEKAAADAGVDVGDLARLTFPQRLPSGQFTLATGDFEVQGLHPNPIRTFAYADIDEAGVFGLDQAVNLVIAQPAAGSSSLDVQRDVFPLPGVASTQPVGRAAELFDEALEQFVGFLIITSGAVLLLAVLIAFNTSRITVDERRREHATMLAFGLRPRTVLGVVVRESVIVGILATVVGLIAGTVMLSWILGSLTERTLPDLGIDRYLSPSTLVIAATVGIVAVAVAPLLLYRRVRRMNVPDTLRVME